VTGRQSGFPRRPRASSPAAVSSWRPLRNICPKSS